MTIIYDLKDHELPIGVFKNQANAAKFLGISLQAIKMALWRDALIFKRYKVVKFTKKDLEEKTK